ncbi:hypothetical protein MCEMIEM13_00750 [Comamonadaceae bacterium]
MLRNKRITKMPRKTISKLSAKSKEKETTRVIARFNYPTTISIVLRRMHPCIVDSPLKYQLQTISHNTAP